MASRRRVLLAGLVAFFASIAVAVADPTPTPAECYTSCAATYSKCTQACKPGDVACYAQCTTTYQQQCLPKCGMPAPPSLPPSIEAVTETTLVGDKGDCFDQCKSVYRACFQECAPADSDCRAECAQEEVDCDRTCPSSSSSSSWSSSSVSSSAVVFNCAWARAEMKRCDDVYNGQPTSEEADDEYNNCIRVPSATIQNDPKCSFPDEKAAKALASKPIGMDMKCLASCNQALAKCTGTPEQCNADYEVCVSTCDGVWGLRSQANKPLAPVMGVRECVKECKAKGKDAANKCKHEKFAKRAACYSQVPNMVKGCESGCTRKPHDALSSMPTNGDVNLPCINNCLATYQKQIQACHFGDIACFSKFGEAYQQCVSACPQSAAWMPKCTTC